MHKKTPKNSVTKNLRKASFLSSNFFPFLVITILCFTFFWRVFIKGQVPFPGDFVVGIYHPWLDYKWGTIAGVPVKNPITADVPSFMYPMQTFAASLMKSGQWPLWNPYILAGAPLLANFQSAPLSPLNIFYFFLSDSATWTLQIISAHILAAFFTYLLLRHWKLSQSASILGGIIFSFSGFNLIWSQWNGHVLTAAFFPLIIYFVDRLATKGGIKNAVGLSVCLALQIFSGYPQLILYTAVVIGLDVFLHIELTKKYFAKLIVIGIFILLGFSLAAIQLLPGYELLSLSQWSAEPHPREWAFLPLEKTITFFAPDYFGNHVTKNYWGPQDYTSNTGFIGVAAGVLALFGLSSFKKDKGVKFAAILAILSLLLSYLTPISEFLWSQNILGMRSSSAHRILVLFNLAGAILAGYGFDYIKSKKINWRAFFIVFLTIFFLFLIFGLYAQQNQNTVALRNLLLPIVVLVAMTILVSRPFFKWFVFLIVIFEIYRFGWKFTPFSSTDYLFPHTPVTKFLTEQQKPFRISNGDTMPVNFQMAYGLETIGGYETMRPLASSQFIAALNNGRSDANPSGRYGIIDNDTSRLLDLVNTKYYLALKKNKKGAPDPEGIIPAKYDKKRFSLAFEDKSTVVLESKSVLPRAFLVHDWEVESDKNTILAKLLDINYPFSKKIILEESPPISISQAAISTVNIKSYEAQKSVFNVKTDKDGMLFVSDALYPGWKAYIDNVETQIYSANYAFRAVMVSSGEHNVEFRYMPKSFSDGIKVSAIALFALLAIFVFAILV